MKRTWYIFFRGINSFFIPAECCNNNMSIHVRNRQNICEGANIQVISHFDINVELLHEICNKCCNILHYNNQTT